MRECENLRHLVLDLQVRIKILEGRLPSVVITIPKSDSKKEGVTPPILLPESKDFKHHG